MKEKTLKEYCESRVKSISLVGLHRLVDLLNLKLFSIDIRMLYIHISTTVKKKK